MNWSLPAVMVFTGFSTSAFAVEYYIYQGMFDEHCQVVDVIPKEPGVIVGGVSGYQTREEAEAALSRLCKARGVQTPAGGQEDSNTEAAPRYHIYEGLIDRRCRVVDHIPKEPGVISGGPLGFATREEAEAWLPKVCRK